MCFQVFVEGIGERYFSRPQSLLIGMSRKPKLKLLEDICVFMLYRLSTFTCLGMNNPETTGRKPTGLFFKAGNSSLFPAVT